DRSRAARLRRIRRSGSRDAAPAGPQRSAASALPSDVLSWRLRRQV
ncbi:MAG: hypothetical protein AVDCRST_MAG52-1363, partial [uncultured Blastococcus sp.]